MDNYRILQLLPGGQRTTVEAIYHAAIRKLDCSPRFKFFTLHGERHLSELFRIADILIASGIELTEREAFLLSLAICIHDLGMVVALKDAEIETLFDGKPYAPDPALTETVIRDSHHLLVENEIRNNISFYEGLGLSHGDMSMAIDISKCHRKVDIREKSGFIKYLGALLRVIDELDIGPNRTPGDVFSNAVDQLDETSTWHWFKHSITERWDIGHNVNIITENGNRYAQFQLKIHPPTAKSVSYWLNQIRRPITRALIDDGCGNIISERFRLNIRIEQDVQSSTAQPISQNLNGLEDRILAVGRKCILLIDDEVRKMEDLFIPVMDDFYVLFASNANDAFDKLNAHKVDLAIVDIQIGSGSIWSAEETNDYKQTGFKIAEIIRKDFPRTKIGFLSGTRHNVGSASEAASPCFNLKKPIGSDELLDTIRKVLS